MKDTLTDLNSLSEFITRGADERLFVDDSGLTRYGLKPIKTNIVNRGSCTCNPATSGHVQLMQQILEEITDQKGWIEFIEQKARELKSNINIDGEDLFEVLFAPSGTDLMYYPLIVSRLLNPGRRINNLVTCIEELGSGTRLASQGKFYANYNQLGERVPMGESILPSDNINAFFYSARGPKGGIQNNEGEIKYMVEQYPDHSTIINLVYGSKSGIEDNLGIIDKHTSDNIIWNVDMCQFRHSRKIIRSLLRKGAMVMITGSKFYQAPPFCAATLVPKPIYNKILGVEGWKEVQGFDKVFSKYDFPRELQQKLPFRDVVNIPGALRWACALQEIKKYNKIPLHLAENKIELWNEVVTNRLGNSDNFVLMPVQEATNKSIISFQVRSHGRFLDHEELREFHRDIVTSTFPESFESRKIFIGQPVAYNTGSYLRMAIGSKNIREFVENDERTFSDDLAILSILESKLNS